MVAETPVNSTLVYVEIVIEPVLVVAETPVKGTPITVTTEPIEVVAETPVGATVGFEVIVIPAPFWAVVAETPVNIVVL